ncbi:MAG: hypothetical protein WKF96_13175 [Solirubrobacteraceae bacterium]
MLRLFEDADDRLGTVVQINCLANRQSGVIVGHAPPPGLRETLPQDLLLALGHRESARGWPRTAGPAWTLARAWMAGFQVGHLIIYGAWRLNDQLVATLSEVARADDVDVSLVNLATMRESLPAMLAGLPVDSVDTLIGEVAACCPPVDRQPPSTRVVLPEGLPPLPPADITCFKAECKGCIEDQELWFKFVQTLDALTDLAARELGETNSEDQVLRLLEEQLRQARDSNDVLVGVRAFQIAALTCGWHVRVPLRDVGFAIAMALNTAVANHQEWPLAPNVDPPAQALAALALGTRRSLEELSAVKIGDVGGRGHTLRDERIAPALRPAIRAQIWMQRTRGRSEVDLLFSTRSGTPMRLHTMRGVLDAISPAAFNASHLGPTRLHGRLAQIVDVTRVASDAVASGSDHEARRGLLPSAQYRNWVRTNGGSHLTANSGLPDVHSADALADSARGFRQAIEVATGFRDSPPWPSNRVFSAQRAHEHLDADGARLHSVLLQTGGGADRLSLLQGLHWSAQRLHTAERTLRTNLSGTAEILATTLDGRLELRVRTDRFADVAVEKIRKRDDCDRGLSAVAARLLLVLLDGSREGVAIDAIQLPHDVAQAAIEELDQRRLIQISANEGWIRLAGGLRTNLRGWEREPMPAAMDFA